MRKTIGQLNINKLGGQILNRVAVDESKGEETKEIRKVIVAKSVSLGFIEDEDLVEYKFKKENDEKKITKENDIIVKITPPFAAALVDKNHVGLLVSSFCIILRDLPDELLPSYLVAYLNSEECSRKFLKCANGSTISTLSITAFNDIDIPLISLESQLEIANAYESYLQSIVLSKQLIALKKEKYEALLMERGKENED